MNQLKLFLSALLLAASSLATAQNADVLSPEYVVENLQKNVTTRAEVIRLFGEPTHRRVRVSSESGSIEYLVYSNEPSQQAAQEKRARKGAGLSGFLRSARSVAGDVAAATGKSYYGSDTADALRKAEHVASAVDRASAEAANTASQQSQHAQIPQLTLKIELRDGVVTSYELGE